MKNSTRKTKIQNTKRNEHCTVLEDAATTTLHTVSLYFLGSEVLVDDS